MMNETASSAKVTVLSPSRRQVELEVPAGEVAAEYEKVLKSYVERVKMPGFRAGHAPKELVKKNFDDDIKHDVYDLVIPRTLERELQALNIKPAASPRLKGLEHDAGGPLRFTAEVEVVPEFELPDYKGVRVKKAEARVTEEDVDRAVEELRARAADYVPVGGRGVGAGDYVVVEIQGRELASRRFLPAEKAVVLAGHQENEAWLNETLEGMEAGETRLRTVVHDKEHPNKRLAGKEVEYRVSVREIKEKKLPGLDDEFAKSVGSFNSLVELRDRLRRELSEAREKQARDEQASEVLRTLASKVDVELPESLVEAEAENILARFLKNLPGRSLAEPALEKLRTEARRQAVEHLKNHLILDRLAEKEAITVSEADIQEEVQRLARSNNLPPAAVEEYLRKEGKREDLVDAVLFRKSVDFLLRNAIIE
jgi:trigger factor